MEMAPAAIITQDYSTTSNTALPRMSSDEDAMTASNFPGSTTPGMAGGVEEAQAFTADGERHRGSLPRFKADLAEPLELLHRTRQGRLQVRDVELHNLLPGPLPGVCHIHAHGNTAVPVHFPAVNDRLAVTEIRIAEAVAESEQGPGRAVRGLGREPGLQHPGGFSSLRKTSTSF